MNIRILTPEVDVTYACEVPKEAPRGAFARFLIEIGIDGRAVVLGSAQDRRQGVVASVPGNWFCDRRKD